MRPALRLVEPTSPGTLYSSGYTDGLENGQRLASVTFFWFGVGVGLVIAAAILLAILTYIGATK